MRLLVLLFLLPVYCIAQHDTIQVCKDKTVYLLFDTPVDNVDTGNKQYAYKKVDNMVALKALSDSAQVTSLMVKTSTTVYVWFLSFNKQPRTLLVNLKEQKTSTVSVVNSNPKDLQHQTASASSSTDKNLFKNTTVSEKPKPQTAAPKWDGHYPGVIQKRIDISNRDSDVKDANIQMKVNQFITDPTIRYRDVAEISSGIYFQLYDIVIDSENIYFKISVNNSSSIPYDIDLVTFERTHQTGLKRRETTGGNFLDIKLHESVKSIFPARQETIIYALSLYAFTEKDIIVVKISELQGKRSLEFRIPGTEFTNKKTKTL